MPTLEWIGKDKVINHHQEVPYRVLERRYSFDADGQYDADNGSENVIIHGDNVDALKAILPRYEGQNGEENNRAIGYNLEKKIFSSLNSK